MLRWISFPKNCLCAGLVVLNLMGCSSSRWSGQRASTSQTLARQEAQDTSDSTGRVRLGQIDDDAAVVHRKDPKKAWRKEVVRAEPVEESTVYELPRTDLDAEPLSHKYAEKPGNVSKRTKVDDLPGSDDEDSVTRSLFEPRGEEKSPYPLYSD